MAEPRGPENPLVRWLVPAVVIAFSAAAIGISETFDRMPPILKRGIQPSDFPQLTAGLIIALTVLMVWREPVASVSSPGRKTWLSLLLMAVFVALTLVDFFLALGVLPPRWRCSGASGGSRRCFSSVRWCR